MPGCAPWFDNPIGRYQIVTSGTRPTGSLRYVGATIFETDTGRWWFWNGTTWVFLPIAKLPRVSVTSSAPLTMNTGFSWPAFDTENYDTDGMHSGSANTLVCPAAFPGLWNVSFNISTGLSTTSGDAFVQVNGTGKRYMDISMANGAMVGATEIVLAAGDALTLTVYNGTGGASMMVTNTNNYFQASFKAST